jgi:UDP-N-acetylmuramate dehydrogenase
MSSAEKSARTDVPLLKNTLQLRSQAARVCRASSVEDISRATRIASDAGLALVPLGEGSNVVLPEYLNALVITIESKGIKVLKDDGRRVRVRVAAGENWHAFVRWSVDNGLYGLENLALIPGTVGAAPVQNIGAYGVEVHDRVAGVEVVSIASGEVVYLDNEACGFAYRTSIFKDIARREWIIASVDFQLDREALVQRDYPALAERLPDAEVTHRDVMETVIIVRGERLPDPGREPNAGSFFKNPLVSNEVAETLLTKHPEMPVFNQGDATKLSAGWMIERCGWRGREFGGVGMSQRHALVLVNHTAHTATEVLTFAKHVQRDVFDEFGIQLAIEPDLLT